MGPAFWNLQVHVYHSGGDLNLHQTVKMLGSRRKWARLPELQDGIMMEAGFSARMVSLTTAGRFQLAECQTATVWDHSGPAMASSLLPVQDKN